jgi:membrane protease YdiL (CAAX protease family)
LKLKIVRTSQFASRTMASIEELVFTLIVILAIAASVSIWAIVIHRLRCGKEVIGFEPRRPVPWMLVDLVLVLMAYFLFMLLARWLLQDLWHIELPGDIRELRPEDLAAVQLSSMAASLATVIFAAILMRWHSGATASDMGLPLQHWRHDLVLGLVGIGALAAPVYALQALLTQMFPTQHPLIDLIEAHPDPWAFVVVGLSVSFVAPFTEEFLLRVMLQGWLERVVADAAPGAFPGTLYGRPDGTAATKSTKLDSVDENPYAAPRTTANETGDTLQADIRVARAIPIVTSAFVFALLHVGQGPAPIPLFFLALGLGYLYQRTHRIWPSAIVHFLLNTSSLTMLWVQSG